MRLVSPIAVLLLTALFVAGCGWSPPGAPPPKADTCAPTDGPSADAVRQAVTAVPAPAGSAWKEIASGHAANCRLYWVQIGVEQPQDDSPEQVLFFDRQTPLGSATPEPRPYITVLSSGDDAVSLQYQWQQGQDQPCCPTGIGSVRFQIGDDGKLAALDPIPGP